MIQNLWRVIIKAETKIKLGAKITEWLVVCKKTLKYFIDFHNFLLLLFFLLYYFLIKIAK